MKCENVLFPEGIGFRCKNCGKCCRDQPADVNEKEQNAILERGFTDFLEEKDETKSRFIKRKDDGSCFFLSKTNKCEIYDIRPEICKVVPFFVTDWDYEKNLIEIDLIPDSLCYTCDGVFVGNEFPIEICKAAQAITNEMLESVADKLRLPKNDKKVLSATRIMIMGMLKEYQEFNKKLF